MEQKQQENYKGITILQLISPDVVCYNTLDQMFENQFKEFGVTVIQVGINEIHVKLTQTSIEFYKDKQKLEFDGFFNYGYNSARSTTKIYSLLQIMQKAGKALVHNQQVLSVLDDKVLTHASFAQHNVPFPESYTYYGREGATSAVRNHFGNPEKIIVKQPVSYAGLDIKMCYYQDQAIDIAMKISWKNEPTFCQKFIPDSIGESVRVVVINGKGVTLSKYVEKSGDFRSNYFTNEMTGMMDDPDKEKYFQIAEKSCESISSNLLIGGVDIVNSKSLGLQVLEINSCPEIPSTEEATKFNIRKELIRAYLDKIQANKQL